ncbi:unnamed protein product [Camellia sinensis]
MQSGLASPTELFIDLRAREDRIIRLFYVRNWTLGGSRSNLLESWKHNALGFVLLSLKGSCDCHFINASCCHDMGLMPFLITTSYTMDGTGVDGKTSQFQSMTFSDGGQACIWSSHRGGCKINIGKQIFCNRSLNMKSIVAVGFDMDYTLAQYKPETFESLAYEGTVRKLVYDLKYPPELLEWTFDWKYMVRGLVLDKKWGNILKMDRHKYVKVAYHGFRELLKEDKVATYGSTLIRDTFDEPNYALIDTLFSLAEAYLFAQLVDFKDNNPGKFPEDAEGYYIFRGHACEGDVRAAVDLCHRDGTLKQMVAEDPKRLWDYTKIVMNFLCGPQTLDSGFTSNFEWLQYFNGQVGGTSMLPLKSLNKKCRVFLGGNVGHLHKLLGIGSSSQVLYVGDHIYGDILRSKKVLGWRTMLVVPELEKEVELLWELKDTRKQLQLLGNERDLVEDKIHHLKWSLKFEGLNDDEEKKLSCKLDKLEDLKESKFVLVTNRLSYNFTKRYFHKVWGQLMKTGYQTSCFAHQVERFACLYTSQVTNLSLYSPNKHYSPSQDFMPHEFEILGM